MLIKSISGVRGIVGTDLSPDIVAGFATAVHETLDPGVIMVGRDSRASGPELSEITQESLLTLGRDVIDCGIVPTPTIQFMVEKTEAAGGIVLTASHNPSEWNGLKFVSGDGTFFNADMCGQLFSLAEEKREISSAQNPGLHLPDQNSIQKHIIHIVSLACIDLNAIRKRRFKVAVDAVNGAASEALPQLLESLGCEVFKLNCDPEIGFPHPPEPLPENLGALSALVSERGADVGIASDPDGDRLAVVSELGDPLSEEYTLVLAADGYLAQNRANETLVTNLSTTLALDKLAESRGCDVVRTPVGEISVVQKMKEVGANLGGEGNGGVILREAHLGRDSLVAAAMVLHRMAQTDEPISSIFKALPQFKMVKERMDLGSADTDKIFEKAEPLFSDAEVNREDGLKFTWDEKWIHLRASNTEPILRIYAEGRTLEEAHGLVEKIKKVNGRYHASINH